MPIAFLVLQIAPRKSTRLRGSSQKVQESQSQAVSKSRDVAAQGLLALNAGIVRRRSRSRSQLSQRHRRRRRGSSSTASISVGEAAITVGEVEENDDMYLDLEDSQAESNARYRRQRGLSREESNIPDSQPPSAQAARKARPTHPTDSDSDSDVYPQRRLYGTEGITCLPKL